MDFLMKNTMKYSKNTIEKQQQYTENKIDEIKKN